MSFGLLKAVVLEVVVFVAVDVLDDYLTTPSTFRAELIISHQ